MAEVLWYVTAPWNRIDLPTPNVKCSLNYHIQCDVKTGYWYPIVYSVTGNSTILRIILLFTIVIYIFMLAVIIFTTEYENHLKLPLCPIWFIIRYILDKGTGRKEERRREP